MLSYTVDTATTSSAKLEYWNRAMREVFRSSWHVQPFNPPEFQMSMRAVSLAHGMSLSQASLSQAQIINSPDLSTINTEHPYYIYLVNRAQKIESCGKTFILQPGDFTIADSALMSTITTAEAYTTIGLTVPAEHFRLYVPSPEQVIGIPFSRDSGLSKTASSMLISMWDMAEADTLREVGNKLATNLLEIVSTCCYLNGYQTQSNNNMLLTKNKIKVLIDNEIQNPELSVEAIAMQLGLSSRYLQSIFAEENDTISGYIRRHRLEGARKQLLDPLWKHHSITDIAFSWGFNNATHFSRVFKEYFGVSAREIRKELNP